MQKQQQNKNERTNEQQQKKNYEAIITFSGIAYSFIISLSANLLHNSTKKRSHSKYLIFKQTSSGRQRTRARRKYNAQTWIHLASNRIDGIGHLRLVFKLNSSTIFKKQAIFSPHRLFYFLSSLSIIADLWADDENHTRKTFSLATSDSQTQYG